MRSTLLEFCLPTKATTVPSGPDWLHEVKYDGYRIRVERDGDRSLDQCRVCARLQTGILSPAVAIARRGGGPVRCSRELCDRARAADEDCSKLFKSNYLREVCSDVGIPSHRQSYVKMECSILKAGHESPSNYPRSSKVIADTERALKDCIIMLAARSQKITFGELRDMGVCGVLVYCADYHCSHSVALSAF
jgi:hypothetical protein